MTSVIAITSSDSLIVELESAVAALSGGAALDFCDGIETAISVMRHKTPSLLIVELSESTDVLRSWQRAIEVSDIPCPVIGVIDDDAEMRDELLVEAVRVGFRDFLRRPASAGEIAGILRRVEKSRPEAGDRGRLLAVASTKGGVGKSTIATNTAVHWARTSGKRVLLVDASLQLGVTASLLNLTPTMTIADVAGMSDRLDATMLREVTTRHASGLHVLAAPPNPADAADVDDECMALVLGIAKVAFDLIVVDSFPLLDATTLAIFDRADHVCIVTENSVPTLSGTAAMLRTLDDLDIRQARRSLVLNRFQKCAGSVTASDVENQLGDQVASVIKLDRRVLEAANLGQPIVETNSWLGVARPLRRLSDDLLIRVSAKGPWVAKSVDGGAGDRAASVPVPEHSALEAHGE